MQPKDRRLVTEQTLEDSVENLNGRIEAVETMAGLSPGLVTDAQTANVVRQPRTQTRAALDGIINAQVAPVARTAQNAAERIDAFEVLTEAAPGNVDDATIALHVSQPGSLARDTVSRLFMDTSSNLFDRDDVTPGYVYGDGEGEPRDSTAYGISGWIAVRPGKQYTFLYPLRVTYFNTDRQYTGNHNFANITDPHTLTAPDEAAWMRISVDLRYLSSAQINFGDELLPYEPVFTPKIRDEHIPVISGDSIAHGAVTPEKTTFFQRSSNLYDWKTVTPDYRYPQGASEPQPSPGYGISEPIRVSGGLTYTYGGNSSMFLRVTFLNEHHVWVADHSFVGGFPQTHTAPPGAVWARLTTNTQAIESGQMNEGDTLLPFEPAGPPTLHQKLSCN